MRKTIYLVCSVIVVLFALVSCGRPVSVDSYAIIPQPVEMQVDKGSYVLSASPRCYTGGVGQNDLSVKYRPCGHSRWRLPSTACQRGL